MRKILLAIVTATVVMFSGCSSTVAFPDSKTGLEGKMVSTYLIGGYIDSKTATSKLESAGFEVIASYSPVKRGTTLVFTNETLKKEASKTGKAHIAVMRLFIDEQEGMISFTNPIYFGKAYMQEQYDHTVFNAELEKINSAFSGLKSSKDEMLFDDLAAYHFMVGMPYYSDNDELAMGINDELVAKAKSSYKKGKLLVFELKLSDTSTLLGYELSKRTKKFVKKIGRANGAILPYTISVENGVASSLEAKYYIALSYPLLTMAEFTTIATVPGAIAKDLAKPFK